MLRDLKAGAKSGGIRNDAVASSGRALSAAGNQSMALLKQGVKGDAASAQYAVAQALSGRSNEDETRIAEMKSALEQQQLQYQLEMKKAAQDAEYNERYLRLQMKLSNGGGGGTGKGPSDNAINAGAEIAQYAQTPGPSTKDELGNEVPGARPGYEEANVRAEALILQYGLKGADALRIYNQVDALYQEPMRTAADLGLSPAHASSTTAAAPGSADTTTVEAPSGATVSTPTPPGGIPFGKDPAKAWERQLSDAQRAEVPAAVQTLYRRLADRTEGGGKVSETFAKLNATDQILEVSRVLDLAGDSGQGWRKGTTRITEDQYNGYLGYALALLKIRFSIGGDQ